MKTEPHVYIMELLHVDGQWRKLGVHFYGIYSSAKYWLRIERNTRPNDKLRIRKYIRSDGK